MTKQKPKKVRNKKIRTKKNPKKNPKKNSKKNTKKISPKYINKILTKIHIILSLPSVEFLPSSNIFNNNNEGHYVLMCDFQELATIINKHTQYKVSPTIQKVFNYQSYDIEDEKEIVFNYNNISCDNLVIKEQKNDNVKLLFLYLLECNVQNQFREIIQNGGNYDINSMLNYDIHKKKDYEKEEREQQQKEKDEIEKIRYMEELRFNERLRLEKEKMKENEEEKPFPEKDLQEINDQNEKQIKKTISYHNEKENEELNDKIEDQSEKYEDLIDEKEDFEKEKDDIIDEKEKEIEEEYQKQEEEKEDLRKQEYDEEQKRINRQNKLQKQIQMKIKGFEEYLESKKVYNISKNSFSNYNTNWFNVCCGIEEYDDLYEKEVNQKILKLGLIINQNEIRDLLLTIFEDKDEYTQFRNMIRNRLITCCDIETPSFFERINPFSNTLGIFKDCDQKSPQSILYLYDDYRKFLEKDMDISRLDRILILIYCEIRQDLFSKYITLEIMRRENGKKKEEKVLNILEKIMHGDRKLIKHNQKLLKQQKEDEYNNYKRKRLNEVKKQIDVRTTILNDKIFVQKNKLDDLVERKEIQDKNKPVNQEEKGNGFMKNIWKLFEKNKKTDDFELNLTPNEKKAYQKAMKKMKGGSNSPILQYALTKEEKQGICKKIKDEKNINLNQLQYIDECFN